MRGDLISIYKYFFYDKTGKLVLWQFPNAPLLIWLVSKIIVYLKVLPAYNSMFNQLSMGFLFIWAYLELTQGVNRFRKLLGWIVMILLIINSY
ncbi:MAG TPA: hypothetical protein PK863_01540 [Candidatus Dojkabacteria bacterium]|nr:hypothetical protein [Candidatus Dojkabacteria bacterium]